MAYYPGATLRLLPEDKTQPRLTPTQLILHTVVGETSPFGTFDRPGCGKESHLWVGRHDVEQYVTTSRTADAQWAGNRHAVSVETADNGHPDRDPWTDWQVEQLAQIAAWAHITHGVPLRSCRSWDDPGIGYHRQFVEWNKSNHSCPGDARVAQVDRIIARAREIVAGALTPQEDDVNLDDKVPMGPGARKMLGSRDTAGELLVLAAQGGLYAQAAVRGVATLAARVTALEAAVHAPGVLSEQELTAAAARGVREVFGDVLEAATGAVDPPQGA